MQGGFLDIDTLHATETRVLDTNGALYGPGLALFGGVI